MKKILQLTFMVGKYYLYGFFLQIYFLNLIYAEPSNAQNLKEIKVNMDFEEASLSSVFTSITNQTDISFFYKISLLKKIGPISIHAENESLEEVLLQLSGEYQLAFKQVNNRISVKENVAKKAEQEFLTIEQVVTGKVTDPDGEPIPGVTVSVPETSIGTVTDVEGKIYHIGA